MRERHHLVPGLASIVVGNRPDSLAYLRLKHRAAEKCGFQCFKIELPHDTREEEVRDTIATLNSSPHCHGIVVQLPLPRHLHECRIVPTIDPAKDVDGVLPIHIGLLHHTTQEPLFLPCTPAGIMEILRAHSVPIAGTRATVIGRSNIVGAPMAALLLQANATVTTVHSSTPVEDIRQLLGWSDIVVSAAGSPGLVRGEWLKSGSTVIDVGSSPVPDCTRKTGFRFVGDVDFDSAKHTAGLLSPVPGGVGPMTIAMLLKNTLKSFKRSICMHNP